jgi:hypothetical protein
MAFTNSSTEISNTAAGELVGNVASAVVLTATSIEDGLKVGRFAKLDTGRLDNMDGSANPTIAGIVARSVVNTIEAAATVDTDTFTEWTYIRAGRVSVTIKAGETPAKFGRVYVSNAGDASDGMALASNVAAHAIPVNARFYEEISTDVWSVDVDLLEGVSDVDAILSAVNASAIPANRMNAHVYITTAGAETRTLANPAFVGQKITISMSVDGGDCVVATASAFNVTGNNRITFDAIRDKVVLSAVPLGASLAWDLDVNNNAALTTV